MRMSTSWIHSCRHCSRAGERRPASPGGHGDFALTPVHSAPAPQSTGGLAANALLLPSSRALIASSVPCALMNRCAHRHLRTSADGHERESAIRCGPRRPLGRRPTAPRFWSRHDGVCGCPRGSLVSRYGVRSNRAGGSRRGRAGDQRVPAAGSQGRPGTDWQGLATSPLSPPWREHVACGLWRWFPELAFCRGGWGDEGGRLRSPSKSKKGRGSES